MGTTAQLKVILQELLGSTNVYIQPPTNTKMEYPCILVRRDSAATEFADNKPYAYAKRYLVTHIDRRPDSTVPDKIAKLPSCIFDRFYTADNLNHDVFKLFF